MNDPWMVLFDPWGG